MRFKTVRLVAFLILFAFSFHQISFAYPIDPEKNKGDSPQRGQVVHSKSPLLCR